MKKCAKQHVVAVIKNKNKIYIGHNECKYPQIICPRQNMPIGVGYELCRDICGQVDHAEASVCKKAGINADGGTLYLFGHTYCCEPCKKIMVEHGIKNIIICE